MKRLVAQAREFLSEPFNRFLVLLCAVLALYALSFTPVEGPIAPQQYGGQVALEIQFFYHPACIHCKDQMPHNQELAEEYPTTAWRYHDVSTEIGMSLFKSTMQSLGREAEGTPTTVVNKTVFVGFDSSVTTQKIREAIEAELAGKGMGENLSRVDSSTILHGGDNADSLQEVSVPLLGKIRPSEHSILALSVILGFIDGFNPCAMWVLVYLISITLTMRDRGRLALIAGTFLFASGALYFLIMAAWLNAFLFLGLVRQVMVIVGAIAIGWGVLCLRDFWKNKGVVACQVGDAAQKGKISREIQSMLSAPLTWATFAGLIALAFTVNSIEFVCSSAIPAVFTQVLALRDLPAWEHYFYIAIYCFFYMLDDIVVFCLAFFAFGGTLGDRIASWGHAIGALILIALGIMLLFFPSALLV